MLHQINDLLTLARLDSGMLAAVSFQDISLNSCLEDAFRLAGPLAEKKNVKISMDLHEELMVAGDKGSLTEAVLNLMENAVKYNHPGGFVAVELNSRAGRAEISVSDTGIGIGAAELERIFDRFYRSDAARGMDGTGLGLSIAKAVVAAHNGEIAASSEPGAGSRFTQSLPLAGQTGQTC
jgi:signal transduction histidine kinase